MTTQQKQVLKVCNNMLREHFDTTQISVSHCADDFNTFVYHEGNGNMLARQASAQHFLISINLSLLPLDKPPE